MSKDIQLIQCVSKRFCTCPCQLIWYTKNEINVTNKRSFLQRKTVLWQSERFAGHSEWQNRKWKKMHVDNKRAKVFGPISLEIQQAVKENGSDPNTNSKLKVLLSKAKSVSMPKDTIEAAIKRSSKSSTENLVPILL